MVAAPPHHASIARALGPVAATLRGALGQLAPVGAPRRTVVAVSGGADSMATLGLLELLRRRLGLELVVAHVDHGLRPGARAESELVMATARARGHATWLRQIALPAGPGMPARARAARRAALLDAAAEVDARLVVLGHTMTDQVETVLLNLCRGAGLDGIGAMSPWRPWTKPPPSACRRDPEGLWVRPMLQLSRDETRGLAARLGLPFVDDPGNEDETQLRVRLRRRVLPELAQINAGAIDHIASTAAIARDAAAAASPDPGEAVASAGALRALPPARRRAAILALCRAAGLAADAVAARTLDGIVAALARDVPHRWDLRGAVLWLESGRIWVAPTPAQPLTHPMPAAILPAPGRIA